LDPALGRGTGTTIARVHDGLVVSVTTDAPEGDVMRVLDEADVHSPYLDVFRRAQRCTRTVRIDRST
jgi:hypothetical protein